MLSARYCKATITAAVVVALVILLPACYGSDAGSASGRPPSDAGSDMLPTATPTLAVGQDATIANAVTGLAAKNPQWSTFIQAVESGDVDTVLGFFRWQGHACAAATSRGGDSKTCAELSVADGTSVPMFPVTNVPLPTGSVDSQQFSEDVGWQVRDDVTTVFTSLLAGRHAALELVAMGGDGRMYLTFSLDPKADSTGFVVSGVTFQAASAASPLVNIYSEVGTQATPLEGIDDAEQRGGQSFDILGVTPELQAEEAAIQQSRHQP